ncbi:pyroglutamyl-peptidase I [Paenibacillus sp. N1-5-1-14]|uniref:pyroglutamyl-peptidase I n=1 Tax=Paenibacillus radicibacter TaxID=2972488 RepID=UPI0021591475|nr:pyroglutamyl-peptidase I [Paenibacillus radicibacter]MCR8644926.1 pyroglutamyl-peptidase I [Paenibacillus radicibacter]
MPNILLTGFDPFGGEKINPALEGVKRLDGLHIDGYTVVSRMIPTVFGESLKRLNDCLVEVKPALIICVGQGGGRVDITVERVAINIDDARIPDNAGNQPIDEPIVPEGPTAYWSTLPIKAIVKKLRDNNVPASVSHTAGTFVCNHLFYGLMHSLEMGGNHTRGGFIHIPFLPEQAVAHPGQSSMSMDTIVQGLTLAIQASLESKVDIREGGGTTH